MKKELNLPEEESLRLKRLEWLEARKQSDRRRNADWGTLAWERS